ncbi:MAG: hypothetical protein BWY05_00654 [Euryarchaeota archaeon ADurb.Bin165]|jgi:hypothetical protein|nr:MAG: hypothetical protein BWY05_00654 [Euryarchaeota archaeon ADurb.Bin165]
MTPGIFEESTYDRRVVSTYFIHTILHIVLVFLIPVNQDWEMISITHEKIRAASLVKQYIIIIMVTTTRYAEDEVHHLWSCV